MVFPAKAKTFWLCHKLAFYLEILRLDFLTKGAQVSFQTSSPTLLSLLLLMFTPHCPEAAQFCLLCISFTKWQFSCHLCLSHDLLQPGPKWTRNFPGRDFRKESYEEWHNSEQSVKMLFFTWQQPCYKFFFFFLREVISSLLVALKYSFLWEKSQCILLLIACVTQFVFSNSSKNSTEKEKY